MRILGDLGEPGEVAAGRHVPGGAPQLADRAVDGYGTHAVLQLGYGASTLFGGLDRDSLRFLESLARPSTRYIFTQIRDRAPSQVSRPARYSSRPSAMASTGRSSAFISHFHGKHAADEGADLEEPRGVDRVTLPRGEFFIWSGHQCAWQYRHLRTASIARAKTRPAKRDCAIM